MDSIGDGSNGDGDGPRLPAHSSVMVIGAVSIIVASLFFLSTIASLEPLSPPRKLSALPMDGLIEYGGSVVAVSRSMRSLKHLFTKIRDQKSSRMQFCVYANRIMTLLSEEGLSYVDPQPIQITTPTGNVVQGEVVDASGIVAVSIIRAGDSLLDCFMKIAPEAAVGKILIQRDEETKQPVLFYSKLPVLVGKSVVLLDPMLATGGSAKAAIEVLLDKGAEESRITFITVVSCPEGLKAILAAYPKIKIVTGEIDAGLDAKAYIVPGLGDYGDRFYGTS